MRRLTLLLGLIASATLSWRASAQPSPTAITDKLRTKYIRPIDFHAAIFPDTVWVGQQATYQVAVLLNADARSRLRRNPEFVPPELRGLLAYELGSPRRVAPRSYGTDVYEAHVFQRALFAVAPGTIVVPSPQLTYTLPQSSSYFSREERYTVSAESAQLVVRPLPDEGKPTDFSGAIGTFRATTRLDGEHARVGDPLVLTVRVEGVGNVKLLPRPVVEVSWASAVPGTERVQIDSSGAYVRGAKEFEYILTPSQAGPVVLPVVRYAYFDPFKGQYAVASTAPADLTIADGAAIAGPEEADDSDLLPLRTWRQQQPWRLTELPSWVTTVALACAVLLPFLAVGQRVSASRSARSVDAAPRTARRDTEPPVNDTSPRGHARRVRKTLLEHLAARLRVNATDLVTRADVQRVLRRRGVTRETTQALLQTLDELAVAGFGGDSDLPARSSTDGRAVEQQADALLKRVETEAVAHGNTRLWSRRLRRAGTLLLVASVIGTAAAAPLAAAPIAAAPIAAAPIAAQQNDRPVADTVVESVGTQANNDAVAAGEAAAAYAARRFPRAAARYAELVARRPNDIDLLMNWGTAAWAANDTVSAVVAWQRAARLDPLAQDIQDRVALLPAGARAGIADVPMVPVLPLAAVAVVAWCLGWGVVLYTARRNDPRHANGAVRAEAAGTSVGALLVVLGLMAGATSWWGQHTLDPESLAVVRRPETIRTAPAADANPMGGASTGDVVRIVSARPGWEQILHADGRRGWIPAARLVSMTAPLLAADNAR